MIATHLFVPLIKPTYGAENTEFIHPLI